MDSVGIVPEKLAWRLPPIPSIFYTGRSRSIPGSLSYLEYYLFGQIQVEVKQMAELVSPGSGPMSGLLHWGEGGGGAVASS